MANIPGLPGYVTPNTYSRVRTIRRATSIPGGLRVLSILGLGERQETLVLNAQGSGLDGVNPDFTGSNAPDGRHFELANTNLITGRSSVYLDGIPLTGTEQTITTSAFDGRLDYRIETSTGRIELQRAHLVDQGGTYALAGTSNVGNGSFSVSLIDVNAPQETWTFRATTVIRDAYGDPVGGNATFTAVGSVSGQPLDAYGAPVVFTSDAIQRDNGILRVTITESSVPFDRGDRFTVKVDSRVLRKGQTLEARYIAESDINDPELFTDPNALFAKHGFPSETNTLALGATMAFENGAAGVLAVQAAPPIPRRTTETLVESDNPLTAAAEGYPTIGNPVTSADLDAFEFTLNGIPDSDTTVNIFAVDRSSGAETQLFPSKVAFYDSTISADPFNNFVSGGGYTYSYTVVMKGQVEDEGVDGAVTVGTSTFSAASAIFSAANIESAEGDTNKQIRIFRKDRYDQDTGDVYGTYEIASVVDEHTVTLTGPTLGGVLPFAATHADLKWELVDPADQSARLLITKDIATSGAIRTRDGVKASYIDQKDAAFFDSNWAAALDALEAEDCQIVVPLPNAAYSAIQQATIAHCESMSSTLNQKERVAFVGAVNGVTAEAVTGLTEVAVEDIGVLEGIQGDSVEEVLAGNIEDLANYSIADNFGSTFRAMYFFPDQITRVINGTATTLHGFYMAAAAGGYMAGQSNFAIPLTQKILTGFSIPRSRRYKKTMLNSLGNAGACTVSPVVGGGQVIHGKTTTASGAPEEEEITIVFIRDRVAIVLRSVLKGFIGQPEDPSLVASIISKVTKTLHALAAQGMITDFKDLTVERDDIDPRQFNVTVAVQPNYPINWIFVDVSVGQL
jgi:hypothetical protein